MAKTLSRVLVRPPYYCSHEDDNVSIFKGVGFHTWQVKVKGYLMKKGLWSVISSNIDEDNPPSWAQKGKYKLKMKKHLASFSRA